MYAVHFSCANSKCTYEKWLDYFEIVAKALTEIGEDIYGPCWVENDEGAQRFGLTKKRALQIVSCLKDLDIPIEVNYTKTLKWLW